ncbi:MAG TPA: hypothetical protein VKV30_07310 [Candidatus Angelobacter sp.]|nr:hypothetical protein [Candidatus Angelobacter sp.]
MVFDKKANSNWQLAVSQKQTLPLIIADNTDQNPGIRKSTPGICRQCPLIATLCRMGLGLGLGLGHPWATQGPRKGHPRATQAPPKGRFQELPLFATKIEKQGVGCGIAAIARDRERKNHYR